MSIQPETRDPRHGDVDYVRQLLHTVGASGMVVLPSLVAAELHVLGGEQQVLIDQAVAHAWNTLTEPARQELAGDVIANLVERGLIERNEPQTGAQASPTADEYRVHPTLGLILLARALPTRLVTCSMPGTRRPGPRIFGLGDRGNLHRAVVMETVRIQEQRPERPDVLGMPGEGATYGRSPLTCVFDYAFMSNQEAARTLAEWAMTPLDPLDTDTQAPPCFLDYFEHQENRPLTCHRVTVQRKGPIVIVVGADPGRPARQDTCDRPVLAQLLERLLMSSGS